MSQWRAAVTRPVHETKSNTSAVATATPRTQQTWRWSPPCERETYRRDKRLLQEAMSCSILVEKVAFQREMCLDCARNMIDTLQPSVDEPIRMTRGPFLDPQKAP